ncbi:helix-turn-helix domain-containing protein [Sphingobacterium sp. SRCM116780]|uniref:helix-turn-helix domain-containing protein n=1 Tax=Sphingobacterium sp. SRCM116780 TaxID=2907623 RepID=UPI001F217790|nr:helix-turn-helix transcriptional regulator [Sphingobacterium sp. SRCM116780]UIR54764.1 helix-turn-helix domain-containing protein [Sphingobacterium sp. SRCM116780]
MVDINFEKDYKLIGENIRKIRKSLNLTQEQLAKRSGEKFDHAKISDIERAKEDFQFITLLKICKGLEITLADLITYKGK